jgi:hypothetical protein
MNTTSVLDFLAERSLRTQHRDAASRATMARTTLLLRAAQQAVLRTQTFLASCPEKRPADQSRNTPIPGAQTSVVISDGEINAGGTQGNTIIVGT